MAIWRRTWLGLGLLGVLAWWLSDATPDPPTGGAGATVQLAHPRRPPRGLAEQDLALPQDALGLSAAPPASMAQKLDFQTDPASRAMWRQLADTPASQLCQRWEQASGGAPEPSSDEDELEQEAAAHQRIWNLLLSSPDPLAHAVGLYGLGMLEMLQVHALNTPDPRITAVALAACRASEHDVYDEDGNEQYVELAPCTLAMAERWTALAPDNAAAWLALGVVAARRERDDLVAWALSHIAQAPAWQNYDRMMFATVTRFIPEDFSWWQRLSVFFGLREVTVAMRPAPLLADEGFCGFVTLDSLPEREPLCADLARALVLRSGSAWVAEQGLRLGFRLDLSESELFDVDEELWLAEQQVRNIRQRRSDADRPFGCRDFTRVLKRQMRMYLEGEMTLVHEDAARMRRALRLPSNQEEFVQGRDEVEP